MEDSVGKFLATQKVEHSLTAAENGNQPEVEYFVDGSAIGDDAGPVACLLDADNGGTVNIVVADGPYTGTAFTVRGDDVTAVKSADLGQKCANLFPGVKHGDK